MTETLKQPPRYERRRMIGHLRSEARVDITAGGDRVFAAIRNAIAPGYAKRCVNVKKLRKLVRRESSIVDHAELTRASIPRTKDGNRLGLHKRRELLLNTARTISAIGDI